MSNLNEELDSRFVCPQCGGAPYHLYRRQTRPGSDIYINELRVGTDGNTEVPVDRKRLMCPTCHVELRRE